MINIENIRPSLENAKLFGSFSGGAWAYDESGVSYDQSGLAYDQSGGRISNQIPSFQENSSVVPQLMNSQEITP